MECSECKQEKGRRHRCYGCRRLICDDCFVLKDRKTRALCETCYIEWDEEYTPEEFFWPDLYNYREAWHDVLVPIAGHWVYARRAVCSSDGLVVAKHFPHTMAANSGHLFTYRRYHGLTLDDPEYWDRPFTTEEQDDFYPELFRA